MVGKDSSSLWRVGKDRWTTDLVFAPARLLMIHGKEQFGAK